MLTRAESKRGHNFKVTDHLPGYKELQDEVLDAISDCYTNKQFARCDPPYTVWVKEVISNIFFLRDDLLTSVRKQKRNEIINEIKILANEGKIRLGPYRANKRKLPFQDRTIEVSPDYKWCEDQNCYKWVE